MEMDAEAQNLAKVGKDGTTLTRDERRRLKDARSRAARSSAVQELEEELSGAPQELKEHQAGFDRCVFKIPENGFSRFSKS